MPDSVSPTTFEGAASMLAGAAADGRAVRVIGGGTKLGWGIPAPAQSDVLQLHTTGLSRTLEHNVGDLTAIFQAGVPLERARAELAAEGQMLAVDPPLGTDSAATIGGVFATADAGPLRHRYGQPRDLIVGITVALSDGTIAKAGGKVIKNVAGYDLAKLFTGSFGTLGLILSLSVRLHPLPSATATAMGAAADPDALARAAIAVARAPLELEALDIAWRGGRGGLLAQVAGAETARRANQVAARMREAGLSGVGVARDDATLWARQRAGQRSARAAIVRVAVAPTELPALLRLTDECDGTLVGRAAFGLNWIELEPAAIERLRAGLPDRAVAVLLDLPPESPDAALDRWGGVDDSALQLMRRIKQRFDPAAVCNPGVFVGGI